MAAGASITGVHPPVAGAGDDDAALVARIRAGERECFHILVRRYERGLYRTVLGIVHNPSDAEEALQETFLRAWRHLGQFRGEAKFQTWVTQIALNTARMKLRKAHRALWESLDAPVGTPEGWVPRQVPDARENPEQAASRGQLAAQLREALRGLPRPYREVLVLRDLQLLSTRETAQVMGLSVANVKTRLLRARLQLRARLVRGFTPPAAGTGEGSHE